jgi:uncharacterized membrane protein
MLASTGCIITFIILDFALFSRCKYIAAITVGIVITTIIAIKITKMIFESLPTKYVYISNQTAYDPKAKYTSKTMLNSIFEKIKTKTVKFSASFNEKAIYNFVKHSKRRSILKAKRKFVL